MYAHDFIVQPSDVSCNGTIKLKNLLDYFQNTAGLAVEDIEGNTSELISKGYAWVLMRYEIEFIGKLPAIDEKFTITTYHDPSHGYNTLRVFDVRSQNGNPIIWAKNYIDELNKKERENTLDIILKKSPSWLLLDLAAGRPVKPAAHLPEILKRDTQEISPDFNDIPESANENVIKNVEFPVKFHDLDYNAHVNNAVYFSWVYDETPIDLMTHELKSVYASFRSGAKLGEKVTLTFSKLNESNFTCKILRENINKPSANFLCSWKEINE